MDERPPETEPDFNLRLKPKPDPYEAIVSVRPEVLELYEEGRALGLEGGELHKFVEERNPYAHSPHAHLSRIAAENRREKLDRLKAHGYPFYSTQGAPYFVYFVQERDGYEGAIKIGRVTSSYGLKKVSYHVRQRKSSMQSCCPHRLEILGWTPKVEEKATHRRFAHLRIRGEWFRPAAELLVFIEEVCDDG